MGYTYDSLDRVTQKLYNDVVKVIFKYDKFGNLYSKNDLFTNVMYKYSYDLSGRTLGISGSDGTSVNYVYDDFSRVSKQISKVQSNTLSTEYLEEDRGRFLVLTNVGIGCQIWDSEVLK